MINFELNDQHYRELQAYEAKRKKIGVKKYQELLRLKEKSHVPITFHLGLLLLLPLNIIEYPATSIIFRLTGLQYPDFKSSRYAILYAQAMSLIKLANDQRMGNGIWPVNLYTIQLQDFSIPQSVCADLASEESTDFGYWINPPIAQKIDDVLKRVQRKIIGSFDPKKIVKDVESSFTNQQTVRKLESLVRLKLQESGMPKGW